MKKLLTAAVVGAFALTGCASEAPAPTPAPSPATSFGAAGAEKASRERLAGIESTTRTTASSYARSDLDMMVEAYQDGGVSFPRSHAAEYADITCEATRDGLSPTRVADMWSGEVTDYSVSDHYILVGAAIGAYCPEQLGLDGY